jgi:hypothetical protein
MHRPDGVFSEYGWPIFTELPDSAEKVYSRKAGFRCIRFPETQGIRRAGAVRPRPSSRLSRASSKLL